MSALRKAPPPGEVLLDYVSPLGRTVTHVRGTVLVTALENLRSMNAFDRYFECLPSRYRDDIVYAIASSWLPVQLVVTHYNVCDELELSQEHVQRAGALAAKRMSDTFFGAALRFVRSAGLDSFPAVMSHCDRFFDRLYKGGGCTTLRTGLKDLVVESHGLPFSTSPYYRAVYASYFTVASALFCKSAFCRYVPAREPDPGTLAMACSWV